MTASDNDERPFREPVALSDSKSSEPQPNRHSGSVIDGRNLDHEKGLELARQAGRDYADTFKALAK